MWGARKAAPLSLRLAPSLPALLGAMLPSGSLRTPPGRLFADQATCLPLPRRPHPGPSARDARLGLRHAGLAPQYPAAAAGRSGLAHAFRPYGAAAATSPPPEEGCSGRRAGDEEGGGGGGAESEAEAEAAGRRRDGDGVGSIELLMGPMFAGKTTRLLQRMGEFEVSERLDGCLLWWRAVFIWKTSPIPLPTAFSRSASHVSPAAPGVRRPRHPRQVRKGRALLAQRRRVPRRPLEALPHGFHARGLQAVPGAGRVARGPGGRHRRGPVLSRSLRPRQALGELPRSRAAHLSPGSGGRRWRRARGARLLSFSRKSEIPTQTRRTPRASGSCAPAWTATSAGPPSAAWCPWSRWRTPWQSWLPRAPSAGGRRPSRSGTGGRWPPGRRGVGGGMPSRSWSGERTSTRRRAGGAIWRGPERCSGRTKPRCPPAAMALLQLQRQPHLILIQPRRHRYHGWALR